MRSPSFFSLKLYADLNNSGSPLRKKSMDLRFPLDPADKEICRILKRQLLKEENAVGFAAPQFGFNKRIIVIHLPDEFPLTLMINPIITPHPLHGKKTDWEVCFSDRYKTALVQRYRKVSYQAFTEEGVAISGSAHGLLARILQHETDHLDGIMPKDRAKKYVSLLEVFGIREAGSSTEYAADEESESLTKRHR